MVATFVESLSYMKKVFLFKIITTIAQSFTFIPRSQVTKPYIFFEHRSELFKCEKYFKSEDYLASHGTSIYYNCHLCGKKFKTNNILTKHFTLSH